MRSEPASRVFALCFALWSLFLAGINLVELFTAFGFDVNTWVFSLLLFAVIGGLCALSSTVLSWVKHRALIAAALFLIALLLRLSVIAALMPEQYSDYYTFFRAASMLYEGDTEFLSGYYWQIWSYQLGYPWVLCRLGALFGGPTVLGGLLAGAVASSASAALVWHIADRFVPGRPACIAALGYCFLTTSVSLCTVLTNQNLAMFFLLLALDVLFADPGRWWRGALAGLLLALANFLRSDSLIYLAAIAAAAIFLISPRALCAKKWDTLRPLLVCGIAVAVYYAVGLGLDFLFRSLNPAGLGNHFPLWKFAVGLNFGSGGQYSEVLREELIANPQFIADAALRDRVTTEQILRSLSAGAKPLWKLFLEKNRFLWSIHNYTPEMLHDLSIGAASGDFPEFSSRVLIGVVRQYDLLLRAFLFLSGIFAVWRLRRERMGFARLSLLLAVLGFSAISLVIEVQYRYSFLVMPVYCILLAEAFRPGLPKPGLPIRKENLSHLRHKIQKLCKHRCVQNKS